MDNYINIKPVKSSTNLKFKINHLRCFLKIGRVRHMLVYYYYEQSLAGVIKMFIKKKDNIAFDIRSLCDIKRSIILQIFFIRSESF